MTSSMATLPEASPEELEHQTDLPVLREARQEDDGGRILLDDFLSSKTSKQVLLCNSLPPVTTGSEEYPGTPAGQLDPGYSLCFMCVSMFNVTGGSIT